MTPELEFEKLVELHYQALYRFALSLAHSETDAADLTQQTFYRLVKNGGQIRDASKAKSWLFTTLHREFLARRRKFIRFPEIDLDSAETDLPQTAPDLTDTDAPAVLRAVRSLDPAFQAVVSLFYLEDYTYPEIAEILEIPLGTVKSRLSRGIAQLQRALVESAPQRRPL